MSGHYGATRTRGECTGVVCRRSDRGERHPEGVRFVVGVHHRAHVDGAQAGFGAFDGGLGVVGDDRGEVRQEAPACGGVEDLLGEQAGGVVVVGVQDE